MSILEHINQLRSRLVKSAVALVVTTTVAFPPDLRPGPRLRDPLLLRPAGTPADRTATGDATCGLAALSPLEPLSIRIRLLHLGVAWPVVIMSPEWAAPL
jgi:sec-independent protein translocase protein TatC